MIDTTFIISIAAMGGLALSFAALLVLADRKLRVKEDPLVERIMEILPMTNCGACGLAGCHLFAELVAKGEAPVNTCIPGGQDVADQLAELLGVESVKARRLLAVVLCRGGVAETKRSRLYRGDRTCISADLVGGEKDCLFSCFGYGDCVDACKYEAMAMNSNGLPVVFYDKCVGCRACEAACPRRIIEMHSEERKLFVYCRSRDKGAVARKACEVACIACRLCVKDCEVEGGIIIEDNLAVINYETCPQNDKPITRCPTKCILFGEEEAQTRENFYLSAKEVV